jgi:hypothetical protein
MKKSVFVLIGSGLLVCTSSLFAQTGGTSGGSTGNRPAQQEKPKATEKAKTKQTEPAATAKTAPKDPPDSGTNKAMNKTDRPPAKTAGKPKAGAARKAEEPKAQ